MLTERFPADSLPELLTPRESFRPFSPASDRDAWTSIDAGIRKAHIDRASGLLNHTWPTMNAWMFLDFVRSGKQIHQIQRWRDRRSALCDLVVGECVEGEGRFLDDIVNGIWAICEETYWGVSPHLTAQKAGAGLPDAAEPTVDLFAAETSALLAWTDYLVGPDLETVSPLIRPRIEMEIQRRILVPNYERDDFWWMGLQGERVMPDGKVSRRRVNNWNPWICSNWIATTLLIERDETRRGESVAKAMRCLDRFIDPYPEDGGCDEGPGYWGRAGASLFECLDWLDLASDGRIDLYDEPLIAEIGRFVYRAHISDRYFVNFADAPPILTPSPALVFRYGQRIDDEDMMSFGAWAAEKDDVRQKGFSDSIGRQLRGLFHSDALLTHSPDTPLTRDVWLPVIQVMTARDVSGSDSGLYIAAKGGHNEESHNHNDVGSFVVFADGKPLIVDAGVETYTRKTFSAERYDIWTMQSAYHSLLPTIDGVQQMNGPEFTASDCAYSADDGTATFALDIAGAYPEEAGVASWKRHVAVARGDRITVIDTYALSRTPKAIACSFLTPCEVDLSTEGQIKLTENRFHEERTSGAGAVIYDESQQTAIVEVVEITDPQLNRVWGDRLYRVILDVKRPSDTGTLAYTISN